jgi:adenylate kinase family enzyme
MIINLFAGPGSGKSTTCAGLFSKLKLAGINCEMALEYAKELVWENNLETLDDQIYVFAQQLHRINILKDKVDVIITDSPLLLSIIYDKSKNKIFKELVKEQFNNFDNLNYYVRRNSIYNPKGRLETIDEAVDKDVEILELLDDNHISYRSVDKNDAVDRIFNDVSHILNI